MRIPVLLLSLAVCGCDTRAMKPKAEGSVVEVVDVYSPGSLAEAGPVRIVFVVDRGDHWLYVSDTGGLAAFPKAKLSAEREGAK